MQSFLYLLYLYVFLQYHGLSSSSSSNSIYIYIHYIIDLLYIFRNHYYFNAERESAAYWCVLINCQKLKFCFNLLCINPHYAPYVSRQYPAIIFLFAQSQPNHSYRSATGICCHLTFICTVVINISLCYKSFTSILQMYIKHLHPTKLGSVHQSHKLKQ